MRRFDGGFVRERFQEKYSAAAGAVQARAFGRVGNTIGRKPGAFISNAKHDLAIAYSAFELDFITTRFAAAMPDRIRHAFGQREQNVML